MEGNTVPLSPFAALVAMILAGCSGGDEGQASFALKDDALREISFLGRVLIVDAPINGQDKENGSPFMPSSIKEAPVTACETGSVDITSGSKRRPFELLPVSRRLAEYTVYEYRNCESTSAKNQSVVYGQDGFFEIGDLGPPDPTNLADGFHHYVEFGYKTDQGDLAFNYVRRIVNDAGVQEAFVESVEGSMEWSGYDYGTESGVVLTRTLRGPDEYMLSYRQGVDGYPFRTRISLGNVSRTVSGQVTYSSTDCAGGQRLLVANAVTFTDDYPSSGAITIERDGDFMTIDLDGEGADLVLPNGGTVRLTTPEIQNAIDSPQC